MYCKNSCLSLCTSLEVDNPLFWYLISMVGHSFQNYDRVYAGFSAAYTCLHTLRMGFKLIYTTV